MVRQYYLVAVALQKPHSALGKLCKVTEEFNCEVKLGQAEVQVPAVEAKKWQYLAVVNHLLSKLPDTACRDTALPSTVCLAGSILQASTPRHQDAKWVTAAECRPQRSQFLIWVLQCRCLSLWNRVIFSCCISSCDSASTSHKSFCASERTEVLRNYVKSLNKHFSTTKLHVFQ